jgi:NTE family protein
MIVTRGWKQSTQMPASELGILMREMGVVHALYTEVGRDGMMVGAAAELTAALAQITGSEYVPFPIIVGMSAGAINAVALAAGADDFPEAAIRLGKIWSALTPDRVYRTDGRRLTAIGMRWMRDLTASGLFGENTINYLLDTAPLRQLLGDVLPLERLPAHFRSGLLRGLAVSATNYLTGTGISFFDGVPRITPWARSLRVGLRVPLTVDHVMASAAIPLFFPPVRIGEAFFGDGCIRMLAPISPAVHLGADRVIAIGVRHKHSPDKTAKRQLAQG